jgi:hypothetical protein
MHESRQPIYIALSEESSRRDKIMTMQSSDENRRFNPFKGEKLENRFSL